MVCGLWFVIGDLWFVDCGFWFEVLVLTLWKGNGSSSARKGWCVV